MYKRSTVLAQYFNLVAAPNPATKDFYLDAIAADIVMNVHNITGMTPTIQTTVVELVNKRLSLPYDGQTANFTAGRTVRGLYSMTTGVIVTDTDGGATGTLTLKNVSGKFLDNEPITEQGYTTPGYAIVNSAVGGTVTYTEGALLADTGAVNTAGSTKRQLIDPTGTAGYEELRPIVNRNLRLKFAVTGTITDLDFDVELIQAVGE